MSGISEARILLEKIENSTMYSRAKDYHNELLEIYRKSKKGDSQYINEYVKKANARIDEMKKSENT